MKSPKSPCIDVCKFSVQNGWCIGCGRTREECQKWKKMKPFDTKALQKHIVKRMLIINQLT